MAVRYPANTNRGEAGIDLTTALVDPARVFASPDDVAQNAQLTHAQKVRILRRWEYDARELAVAADEGMTANGSDLLTDVHVALEALGETLDLEHEPPTKQGGVASNTNPQTESETMAQEAVIKEAVGVFHHAEALEAAIDDLEEHGFDRACFSLLAGEKAVREKLTRYYVEAKDLEDNPHAPHAAYVSRESLGAAEGALIGGLLYIVAMPAAGAVIASGGAVGAALLMALFAGGASATVGGVLARFVDVSHANYIDQQLDRGGLLLWVRVDDEENERRAIEILKRHAGDDVHIHAMPYGYGRKIPYRKETIEEYAGSVFFACGRLFESLTDAKAFVDRQRSVQAPPSPDV